MSEIRPNKYVFGTREGQVFDGEDIHYRDIVTLKMTSGDALLAIEKLAKKIQDSIDRGWEDDIRLHFWGQLHQIEKGHWPFGREGGEMA